MNTISFQTFFEILFGFWIFLGGLIYLIFTWIGIDPSPETFTICWSILYFGLALFGTCGNYLSAKSLLNDAIALHNEEVIDQMKPEVSHAAVEFFCCGLLFLGFLIFGLAYLIFDYSPSFVAIGIFSGVYIILYIVLKKYLLR